MIAGSKHDSWLPARASIEGFALRVKGPTALGPSGIVLDMRGHEISQSSQGKNIFNVILRGAKDKPANRIISIDCAADAPSGEEETTVELWRASFRILSVNAKKERHDSDAKSETPSHSEEDEEDLMQPSSRRKSKMKTPPQEIYDRGNSEEDEEELAGGGQALRGRRVSTPRNTYNRGDTDEDEEDLTDNHALEASSPSRRSKTTPGGAYNRGDADEDDEDLPEARGSRKKKSSKSASRSRRSKSSRRKSRSSAEPKGADAGDADGTSSCGDTSSSYYSWQSPRTLEEKESPPPPQESPLAAEAESAAAARRRRPPPSLAHLRRLKAAAGADTEPAEPAEPSSGSERAMAAPPGTALSPEEQALHEQRKDRMLRSHLAVYSTLR
ncbi:Hypothetical Protein FCC1311_104212 [Hondaea fermentalgiana]|uniref:Uncharacterized protein n=1 Tax=Hondaea fermentalgiana TaxID=2315210 RepID=A0A2R5GTJ8_9STRA|nr:Hypothetical Protein FCC1311_104212 [Hondaea fermentalgiana]|eukprot:GBG34197.1 Hypothetical Protein FCC1311_104212 [Hondaea fermentalgiana]